MSELESFTAANRFGLGAHPANVGRISPDPRGWLTRQIEQPDSFQLNAPSLPGRPQVAQALATDFTVHLTPVYNGVGHRTYATSEVEDGAFTVYGPPGVVHWLVHGQRLAIAVEPAKKTVRVQGSGPYRWIA